MKLPSLNVKNSTKNDGKVRYAFKIKDEFLVCFVWILNQLNLQTVTNFA